MVLTGVAAIVATGGAATPVVISVGGKVAGGTAIVFGAAEVSEGHQRSDNARQGKFDEKPENWLRDNIFGGNEQVYNVALQAVTFSASSFMGAAGAGAKGVKDLAQVAIGIAAGDIAAAVTSAKVYEMTESPAASLITGIVIGEVTSLGVTKLGINSKVNLADEAGEIGRVSTGSTSGAKVKGSSDVPTAFKQTEFASSYDARINQTPAVANKKVQFIGDRGESLCILKPPPDSELEKLLREAGVEGVLYKNAVPDFSPFSKAEVEINYMVGGNGTNGNKARELNFQQANSKLAQKLNESPELAQSFGMKAGNIKVSDIEKYRIKNDLTWHELNDGKTLQLVPTEINSSFGHLGGVGEINAGIYKIDKRSSLNDNR